MGSPAHNTPPPTSRVPQHLAGSPHTNTAPLIHRGLPRTQHSATASRVVLSANIQYYPASRVALHTNTSPPTSRVAPHTTLRNRITGSPAPRGYPRLQNITPPSTGSLPTTGSRLSHSYGLHILTSTPLPPLSRVPLHLRVAPPTTPHHGWPLSKKTPFPLSRVAPLTTLRPYPHAPRWVGRKMP